MFELTKWIIGSSKSEDRQYTNKNKNDKSTTNDQQNIT
jgi:hypothetical protein